MKKRNRVEVYAMFREKIFVLCDSRISVLNITTQYINLEEVIKFILDFNPDEVIFCRPTGEMIRRCDISLTGFNIVYSGMLGACIHIPVKFEFKDISEFPQEISDYF